MRRQYHEEPRGGPSTFTLGSGRCSASSSGRREAFQRKLGRIVPYVFWRDGGKQIREFRDSWRSACRRVGCPGPHVHDLRRSAVRNLIRAGVSEHVAMRLTGHKTSSMLRRYDIVSTADLRDAVAKLAARESEG